ncbi:DUF3472 domain-containing protein [Lentzea sp. NPDC051213]|uniref:DUF3472 domain-containing protein n=1 Tax=Lentzea sp. NPDC051213 TaxID=3364126 RepID=UPI0037AABC3E
MRRLTQLAIATTLLFTGIPVLAGQAAAAQAETKPPVSYTDYAFAESTRPLDDITFGTTVLVDPGRANVFWSNQFGTTIKDHGGYIGMQSHRDGVGMFLFSMWNTTVAEPGDEGTRCKTFGGEGTGMQCSIDRSFVAGHSYQFSVSPVRGNRLMGVVTDTTTLTSIVLGTIEVGEGVKIATGGMSSFVEYFDQGELKWTCADEPFSKSRFEVPRGNRYTIAATITGTPFKDCDDQIKVTKAGAPATANTPSTEYVVHENAIGNSASGPIRHTDGSCVSTGTGTAGGALDLAKCTDWVLAADGTIHTMTKCLDVEKGHALLSACDGRKSQQWTLKNGVLRNVDLDRCLEPYQSGDSWKFGLLWCGDNDTGPWTVPGWIRESTG